MSRAVCSPRKLGVWLTLMALAGGACSSGGGGGADGAAGDAAGGDAAGGLATLSGAFSVELKAAMLGNVAYMNVGGTVRNGPRPQAIILEPAATQGGCTLLTPRVPFCAAPCGGTAVCVEDDRCQPNPLPQNVGDVTMTGVKTVGGPAAYPFKLVSGNYQTVDVALPYPAFDEGADLSISATGGAYPPFTVHARGIAPLVVPEGDVTLEKNKAVTLTWTPAGITGISTIHLKIEISHHGGSKGQLECDGPDTGALTVPAALVTQLINLGFAGYPALTLTRRGLDSTAAPAVDVRLDVFQDITRDIALPGLLVSCTDPTDCPTGKTCQTDLSCK